MPCAACSRPCRLCHALSNANAQYAHPAALVSNSSCSNQRDMMRLPLSLWHKPSQQHAAFSQTPINRPGDVPFPWYPAFSFLLSRVFNRLCPCRRTKHCPTGELVVKYHVQACDTPTWGYSAQGCKHPPLLRLARKVLKASSNNRTDQGLRVLGIHAATCPTSHDGRT